MRTEELTSSPGLGGLLLKAALTARGRRGDQLPDLELVLRGVVAAGEQLAGYARVCGFRLSGQLPPTYPHILGFPLAMRLMTDPSFPFPLPGLVHVSNRISQLRTLPADTALDLRVWADSMERTDRGTQFVVHTEASADGEVVWREQSQYLRRERASRSKGTGRSDAGASGASSEATSESATPSDSAASTATTSTGSAGAPDTTSEPLIPTAIWRLPDDLGRRYAAVSGDHNPIHLHPLTARLGGFRRPIVHGMWTLARCLAALEGRLPEAVTVDIRFRKPISLPSTVGFAARPHEDGWRFAVTDRAGEKTYLTGTTKPA